MGCAAGWSHIFTAGLIGVAFSIELPEWGRTFSRGVSKQGFENEKIRDYEVVNVTEHEAAILKFGTAIMITLCTVIIARYDAILDQSEHAHPYDHLSEQLLY